MSLKVAIMQPYFFPYAGYFRLFTAADLFVVLDCVQFPRRGWVHRNHIHDSNGESQWMTLPIIKGARDTTRICDLEFQADALQLMSAQFRRFPVLTKVHDRFPELELIMSNFRISPIQYLIQTLRWTTELLGISKPMIVSSELGVPSELHAQDRIIEIAKRVGAAQYINAPGGHAIYEAQAFNDAGMSLNFLSDYDGSFQSILERVLLETPDQIKAEVIRNTRLEPAG